MAHLDQDAEIGGRPDALKGRLIGGKFRIEALLGAGGMGNVYRAEQISLHKQVALKILHRDLMTDETVVKRFEREARSASRLDHPNLVRIIDFGRDAESGVLFIAMELLSGRDLGQVIAEDSPLPLHRIVRIMSQVLSALEEAHVQGVIHRDLKPANIMLVDRRGELDLVKVCDFGIAKSNAFKGTDSNSMLTVRGFVCGTPEYMAPEQARGEDVDGRSDLYAAAVILYQLVTGNVPFTASSPVGILSQHLDRSPPAPSVRRPDIPRALEQLIIKGLAKDPADRPQTASAFRQELESVCSISAHGRDDGTTQNQTVPAVAAVPRPPRRGPQLRKVGFTAGLLAGLVGATFTYVRGRSDLPPTPPISPAEVARSKPREEPRPEPIVIPPVEPGPEANAVTVPSPGATEPAKTTEETPTATIASRVAPMHHHHPVARPAPRAIAARTFEANDAEAAVAIPPSTKPVPSEEPSPHSPREMLADAERLLSQGEVSQACARGEEARQLAPRLPAISRFLGKCYMRAGNPSRASENYRKYLELAPDATDAAFIKSIVK